MRDELSDIYENIKTLKKQDVKSTEKKMEKSIIDTLDNNEIGFINDFLKKGEMIDGKKYKSIDSLLAKYKKKIGASRIKSDPNIMMLAPILASMEAELKK